MIYYVKLNAIHKLGSSQISAFPEVPEVSQMGYLYRVGLSVMKILSNLGKAKAHQRLN